ncbi:hypothetical protein CSKR_203267 [Clonorchis sinensis]|uniref:F-box domain-containing protein n=1 Tax=Clonorchis sinensis TaxID=79923 RepID=A0A8T1M8Z6_CLOSI|nr:hypothetical protein CSKR_203267 [Clonorchis sinensis]
MESTVAKYVRTRRRGRPLASKSITDLPDDLTYEIFKWLSLRDLCTCAYVCKRWWQVSRAQTLWSRHYRTLMRKVGKRNVIHPFEDISKQHVLNIGQGQSEPLLRSMFRQHLDFRKHLRLTTLRLSIKLEVHQQNRVVSASREILLPTTLCQQHCELLIDLCDVEIFPQNLQEIVMYCAVPLFPEKILSYSESPRQFVVMKKFDMKTMRQMCRCDRFTSQNVLLLHNCIYGLLIGQWPASSLAFVSGTFTLNELKRALKTVSNLRGVKHSKLNTPLMVDFSDNFDLCGYLLGTDGLGNIVLSNSWRSFEISGDHKILLSPCEHGLHIPFEKEPVMKITVGSLEIKLQDAFILRFLACRPNGDHVCDLSGSVFLIPATNEHIQFGEEDGDRYRFELRGDGVTLTGLVLRNRERARLPKLIELELAFRRI